MLTNKERPRCHPHKKTQQDKTTVPASSWSVRALLQTHQRNTIVLTGTDGTIYHLRVSRVPETEHAQIYKTLGIKNPCSVKNKQWDQESSDLKKCENPAISISVRIISRKSG